MEKSSQGFYNGLTSILRILFRMGSLFRFFFPPLEVLWPSLSFFLITFFDESLQLRHSLEVTTFRRIDDCIVFNTVSVVARMRCCSLLQLYWK